MDNSFPTYDRSLLPNAKFEFVVIADTHFILDPEPYAVEFDSVREWPQRGSWAWGCVAALGADFVVHLGDLTEENAARPQQVESRRRACEQFEKMGLQPLHVAGNMDVGDKPDATMWTEWVTPESLGRFHEQFGRSWYSYDHQDLHCVFLNSQIMNGPLSEAADQQAWLETDLAAHSDRRLMMFLHMPPFFVEEGEPDTGFYNSINEPARSWLTNLMRQYEVEYVFSGHTHFRVFNRVGETRCYVSPSTTTSRSGFYEAFSVAPAPEQGRNDPAKLGLYLVRVCDENIGIHFVRTHGQTGEVESEQGWRRLLFRKTRDLPCSPLSVYLRTPIAYQSEGALAWPSVLRQRVRDDHPFLSLLEAGVQHVRVPVSDLEDGLQSGRLDLLRAEGVAVTAVWLWSERLDLARSVGQVAERVDTVELQVPGELFPDGEVLNNLVELRRRYGKPVVLTPIIAREATQGKYHPRTRFGYREEELEALDRHLDEHDMEIDRVLCHIDLDVSPWESITSLGGCRLNRVSAFDYVVRLPGVDERDHLRYAAEGIFASALQAGCRLYFDTLVDMDRTNDLNYGLLDRLSNPRAVYYLVQCLNTMLFSGERNYTAIPLAEDGPDRIVGIENSSQVHRLILPGANGFNPAACSEFDLPYEMDVVDLVRGMRQTGIRDIDELRRMLAGAETPYLVSHRPDR